VLGANMPLARGAPNSAASKTKTPSAASPSDSHLAGVGAASVPPSTPTEKRAAKLAKAAVGPDFDAGRYQAGEKKLREAILICTPKLCSNSFSARLHRDLGFIYIAGLEKADEGRDEFEAALNLDSTVLLPFLMQTGAVHKAFDEVKERIKKRAVSAPVQAEHVELNDAASKEPDESAEGESTSSESKGVPKRVVNWLSLAVQQDLVIHAKSSNVCAAGSAYECFDSSGGNQVLPAGASQISGTTLSRGALRLLLGFDRVVFPDASVGVRAGVALFGQGRRLTTDPKYFMPHFEARLSLWLGHESFSRKGLRPYLYLGGGLAEADGKVSVSYVPSGGASNVTYDAWKHSGHVFVGAGFGVQYAYVQSRALFAELSYMAFMSPDVPVLGIQLGYAYGL